MSPGWPHSPTRTSCPPTRARCWYSVRAKVESCCGWLRRVKDPPSGAEPLPRRARPAPRPPRIQAIEQEPLQQPAERASTCPGEPRHRAAARLRGTPAPTRGTPVPHALGLAHGAVAQADDLHRLLGAGLGPIPGPVPGPVRGLLPRRGPALLLRRRRHGSACASPLPRDAPRPRPIPVRPHPGPAPRSRPRPIPSGPAMAAPARRLQLTLALLKPDAVAHPLVCEVRAGPGRAGHSTAQHSTAGLATTPPSAASSRRPCTPLSSVTGSSSSAPRRCGAARSRAAASTGSTQGVSSTSGWWSSWPVAPCGLTSWPMRTLSLSGDPSWDPLKCSEPDTATQTPSEVPTALRTPGTRPMAQTHLPQPAEKLPFSSPSLTSSAGTSRRSRGCGAGSCSTAPRSACSGLSPHRSRDLQDTTAVPVPAVSRVDLLRILCVFTQV
ncbi:transcription initiation factor TFIID subunit 4-like isoform X2 [Agelaius tricolor]|uniref:transcription initiation factor TFIID subunit 4-like isoform X2 n=1 Tax=Agelaius tricolor TaxID=9191 RepID=UPI0039F1D4CA